ncbi:MAG: hypothetical protein IJ251_04750 [Oscillospiraceae bacterium]|nr:hypothetical protein [Oscillospiraceae bacterium]
MDKKSAVKKFTDVCVGVINAVGDGIKFIIDNIDPSDALVKINMPYSRQSFAENVRNASQKKSDK